MEPWAFDSPAMRALMPRLLAGDFSPLPYLPVARTDDDPITTRMILQDTRPWTGGDSH